VILSRRRVSDRPGPAYSASVPAPRPAAPALLAHHRAVSVHRRYAPHAMRLVRMPLLFFFHRCSHQASALTRVAAPFCYFVLLDGCVELYA